MSRPDSQVLQLFRLRRPATSRQLDRIRSAAAARAGGLGGPVVGGFRRRCMAAPVARGANGVAVVTDRVKLGPIPVALLADNSPAGAWARWRGGLANAGGSLRSDRARLAQGGRRSSKVSLDRARMYVAMRFPPSVRGAGAQKRRRHG